MGYSSIEDTGSTASSDADPAPSRRTDLAMPPVRDDAVKKNDAVRGSVAVAVASPHANGVRRAPVVRCDACEFKDICPAARPGEASDGSAPAYFLDKGAALFRAGRAGRHMYLLRAGSLKSFVDTLDGEYQLTAFHLPGELIGFDLSSDDDVSQLYTTVAMERSQLCEVDSPDRSGDASLIQQRLYRLIGAELRQLHANRAMVGRSMAHQRMALFLLDLSERQRRLRRDPDELRLSMSRLDIASFLGLAVETVSRMFTRLQAGGLIAVEMRTVRLLDRARLVELAGVYEPMPGPPPADRAATAEAPAVARRYASRG
jgi:CRP/FNR family transcriptional regulator